MADAEDEEVKCAGGDMLHFCQGLAVRRECVRQDLGCCSSTFLVVASHPPRLSSESANDASTVRLQLRSAKWVHDRSGLVVRQLQTSCT